MMANAERYAQWIVDNQDKQGTPEFDTIAAAYRAARAEAPATAQPAPKPDNTGDFMRGLTSYGAQTQETLGGAQALLGAAAKKTLGEGAVSNYLLEHGAKNLEEAGKAQAKTAKASDSLSNAWDQGIGTVLTDWLPYQAGSGVANIGETLAMALLGGVAGSAVAPGVGTAAGAAEGLLGKTLLKKGIKEAAEKILKTEGKEAAQSYIEAQAKKSIASGEFADLMGAGAKAYGKNIGMGAQAIGHGIGEVGSRAAEEATAQGNRIEDINLAKALPAAAGHAVADFVANKIGLGALDGLAKPTQSMLMNVAKGIGVTGAKEVPPELLQSALERYGAGLPLHDKEAIKEYIDTAGAAFGMSALPGGYGGFRSATRQPDQQSAPTLPEVPHPDTLVAPATSNLTPPEEVRSYGELVQELERLKREQATPEVKAEIKALKSQLREQDAKLVEGQRAQDAQDAQAEQEKADAAKAKGSAFATSEPQQMEMNFIGGENGAQRDLFGAPIQQEPTEATTAPAEKPTTNGQLPLGLRRTPEGQPTASGQPEPTISAEDIMLTAIPLPKPVQQWVEKNVAGRTLTQVRSMVAADPTLIEGKDPRAKLLTTLLTSEVPAFEEAPSVKTTQAPTTEPTTQPRGGEPSVAVPSKPARTRAVAPRPTAVPATAGAPAKPVGLGLVPSEQPVSKGDNAPVAQPSALSEEEIQRQKDAEFMKQAMAAQDKIYARGPATTSAKPAAASVTPAQKVAEKGAAPAEDEAWTRISEKMAAAKNPFEVLDTYAKNKGRKSVNRMPGQTIDELQAEIAADKTSAGKALSRLMKSGKVKLVDKSPIPGLGGEFDGKTVTLYADGIPKGHAIAVALHEAGAHMGMKKMLGAAAYQKVADRIVEMAKSKEASPERSLAQRALNRIPDEDVARGQEVIDDEAIAYFVEELAKAEASGELPKTGPLRAFWNQIRAALVSAINRTFGTTFGMGDLTPEQIGAFASSALTRESKTGIDTQAEIKKNFSVSYNAEQIIDSMGPLDVQQKSALKRLIEGFQAQGDVNFATKARTQVADVAATIESRLSKEGPLAQRFDGAVRNSLGKLNPMGLYRQAQDYSKLLLEYFQTGTLVKDKDTGLYRSEANKETNAPAKVYDALTQWGNKHGYSFERANNLASRILEAVRLDAMREANKTQGTDFVIHMKDADIDTLVAEYKADKDLQGLSDLMDKPRIELVNHMINVGRLTPEEGAKWKEVVGYVPFDRIEDFAEKFNKVKKISGKGIAQVGKLPELVGSLNRPVGNVFDNYINTLGWMVGQVTKTDATINTLRSLENIGHAKFLGNTTQGKDNTVGAYVKGEMQYFQLPTKYDVMAFKDLNPPKAKWLQGLGAFSNILRTTVTAMPPFALKQVTDDVQRAIMTSGVKSPTALIRMSLTNFPKLALAELRGIQHPFVKEFGALGLTGEFDFQQGKPAVSLLGDLGYKPRGKVKELLHRLEGITRASDLAVRKAIYDQTIKETNDALLAQTRAREFINFRRRGASDFVGAMVTTIPFFNAYIQGMDVLYRAASGADSSASVNRAEARKMFWNRAATVLALSTLYAMGKSDDDDYNEMDLRTRDGNWVLGNGVKLPVPTELGALFKVIPERAVEYMRRQGTPEEQEAFEAVRTAAAYIFEQYVGRTVPIPQAAKPLLEAWTNHSFLTGRALEGIHQKGMVPSMRTSSGTSELAIQIAKFAADQVGVEVSPIMIDNALRGYLGSTAATATLFTDSLLNPTRMDRPLHKWALVSNYAYDPVGTRRTSEFYDTREQVGQLNNTLNDLAKTDINAAEKFYNEHAQELALASSVNATLKQIEGARAYRKYLDSAEAAATMTQQERQDALEEVRKYEVEMVRWLRDAKTQLRTQ